MQALVKTALIVGFIAHGSAHAAEPPSVASLLQAADRYRTGADALLIVTEWMEFRNPDFDFIKATLKHPVIFDGRNLYDPELMRGMGIDYLSIGRPAVVQG